MTIDFVKGFCNYTIFGFPMTKEAEQKEPVEKSFYEEEKEALKWTFIDAVAQYAILRTVLPYVPSLDHRLTLATVAVTGIGASFFLRQIHILGLVILKKQSEELNSDVNKDLCLEKKKISTFKDFMTASLPDIMGWDKGQVLAQRKKIFHVVKDFFPAIILANSFSSIQTLVHEYGHFFANKYFSNFDKDLGFVIELSARGGVTKTKETNFPCPTFFEFLKYICFMRENPFNEQYSYIDKLKALNKYDIPITIAGPLVENMFSTSFIVAAHFQTNSYIRHFFNISAIMSIQTSLEYAQSAFSNVGKSSHDFAVLWEKGGIHPYVSMACIAGLPIITKLGLLLRDYLKSPKEENSVPTQSSEILAEASA